MKILNALSKEPFTKFDEFTLSDYQTVKDVLGL